MSGNTTKYSPSEMEWGSPKIGMMTQPLRQIISSMLRCKWVEKWKWSGKTCSKALSTKTCWTQFDSKG